MNTDEHRRACTRAAELLRSESSGDGGGLVAGFDGFVDRIIDVVDQRSGPESYTRIRTIADFAQRIGDASGRSANLELVARRTALGGNGAILARAGGALGVSTCFLGTVGASGVNRLFEPLTRGGNRVFSLGAPGKTEALEFDDGKLLLGEPSSLDAVTWEAVIGAVGGVDGFRKEVGGSVLAMGNWTMTAGMTEIWSRVAREVLPGAGCLGVFVDLADPAKRTDEDLIGALDALRAMNAHAPVTVGLNTAEAARVARVLGVGVNFAHETPGGDELEEMARALHGACGVAEIALHTRRAAALVDGEGVSAIDGPFLKLPVATTGAGDHFNAGLCVGALLGAEREARLAIGVGCSGLFVRTGASPAREELAAFLERMPEPE